MEIIIVMGHHDKIRGTFEVVGFGPSPRLDTMELWYRPGTRNPIPGEILEVFVDGSVPYAMAPLTQEEKS